MGKGDKKRQRWERREREREGERERESKVARPSQHNRFEHLKNPPHVLTSAMEKVLAEHGLPRAVGPYTSTIFLPGPTPVEPLYGSGQICSHDHTFVAMSVSSIFTVSGVSTKTLTLRST